MTAVSSVAEVDAWIDQLSECKQLAESDIRKLCEKVLMSNWIPPHLYNNSLFHERHVKF